MEQELFPPFITSVTLFIPTVSDLHFFACTMVVLISPSWCGWEGQLIVPVNHIKVTDLVPIQGVRTRGTSKDCSGWPTPPEAGCCSWLQLTRSWVDLLTPRGHALWALSVHRQYQYSPPKGVTEVSVLQSFQRVYGSQVGSGLYSEHIGPALSGVGFLVFP